MGGSDMGVMGMTAMAPKTTPPAMSMTKGKKTETPTTQPTPAPTETPTTQPTPAPTAPPFQICTGKADGTVCRPIGVRFNGGECQCGTFTGAPPPPVVPPGPTCTPCTAEFCGAFNTDSLKAAVDDYTADDTKKAATIDRFGPIECW
jgi:hypothetical protein